MDANGHPQPHVLGAFDHRLSRSHQIGTHQRLEPKIIDQIISVMNNHVVECGEYELKAAATFLNLHLLRVLSASAIFIFIRLGAQVITFL